MANPHKNILAFLDVSMLPLLKSPCSCYWVKLTLHDKSQLKSCNLLLVELVWETWWQWKHFTLPCANHICGACQEFQAEKLTASRSKSMSQTVTMHHSSWEGLKLYLVQGHSASVLKGHCPPEFGLNANQTHLRKPQYSRSYGLLENTAGVFDQGWK